MPKKNSNFRFKQFSLQHGTHSMKIGTDGVLIGCWADVSNAKTLLDIGTGSGLIALMLAQRTPDDAIIHAVEIDSGASEMAKANVAASPWPEKVTVHNVRIQDYDPKLRYDHIVSNPPFFVNSFLPPDKLRKETRHTASLSFRDLIDGVDRLLEPHGRFSVILPPVEGAVLREHALQQGLTCSRLWAFRAREQKPVERWLMEFRKQSSPTTRGELTMYGRGEEWTEAFKELSADFYIHI